MKHVVAPAAEIPPGGRRIVTLEGRSIGVFNVRGEFFALRNACPHQGGPLCQGVLTGLAVPGPPGEYGYLRRGEILRCPWHGWEFDVRTGQSCVDPARTRVRTYPVELVPGPYVAETYRVTVEGDVVLVDVSPRTG
ncbi:MAG TPA: Rieske (2Fe-2S) protein [Candidatus Eisenbacteria bacterium]|nr:Rieske (2Fe-2S) protein [Candidatus Eisenbacteria bacterium]